MKTLTIQNPYGTLIVQDRKHVETRSWGTAYRGPIAIHIAKKKWLDTELELTAGHNAMERNRGCIAAVATLVDCFEMTREYCEMMKQQYPFEYRAGFYSPGRYAWILSDIKPLDEPVPMKGMLGLWNADIDLKED